MLNSTEHDISTALKKTKKLKIKTFLAFKLSKVLFIVLINVKMPKIVGILTFMSMINFIAQLLNKNTKYKTNSDVNLFYLWASQTPR